jgi:tRNA modification GTPase
MTPRSNIFAVLTPPGTAAVATVAVAGPDAWGIVRRSFRPAESRPLPQEPPDDRFWYGQFGGPPGDAVVIAVRRFARDSCVEVHCHGGPEVVRMVSVELARLGATTATPEDLLERIGEPAVVAAVALTRAPTLRTAVILLDQVNGAFAGALAEVDRALAETDLARARELVAALAGRSALGRHLTRPWRVVVAGAPNVGKSSLVNALAGYQRSVVTPIPGTTRDAVATAVAIDGWPVELIDTAGQHTAGDVLEGQGIARAKTAAAAADLCLWVLDVAAEPVWPNRHSSNFQFVVNKSDLTPTWNIVAVEHAAEISARTGAGLDGLCERISRRLVPDPPPPGTAVPFTDELADIIALIKTALTNGDIGAARAALVAAASR